MSDLAAALGELTEQWKQGLGGHLISMFVKETIEQAARERLRLSKIPCETCGGAGKGDWITFDDGHAGGFPHHDPCPSCGGSGEVWPAELVEAGAAAIWNKLPRYELSYPECERIVCRVLDVSDVYAKEEATE